MKSKKLFESIPSMFQRGFIPLKLTYKRADKNRTLWQNHSLMNQDNYALCQNLSTKSNLSTY